MDLSSITTHAQRLSARIAENISERSKDLGLDAEYNAAISPGSTGINQKLPKIAQGILNNSRLWDRHLEISSVNGEIETKKLLGSKHENERLEGLKRILVLMCKKRSVLSYFPFVSNCLHSPTQLHSANPNTASTHSFTIRHLVSIYILHHAHLSPDLALLSVNSWQKDLSDSNPVMRSLALKTLAGMSLESVLPLVMMSINRLLNDSNWFVRCTVAESLIDVFNVDARSYGEALIEGPLTRMLKDRSPLVIGSVLTAWEIICPNRWDLIHRQYRFYCRSLLDADENGQNMIMRLMTRYAREHLQDPNRNQESTKVSDPDLELLLNAVTPLFHSKNPSIIISATNVFLYIAPLTRLGSIVDPLMRLLSQTELEQDQGNYLVVLHQIYQILVSVPGRISELFQQYLSDFFISCASDSRSVKLIKLKILTTFVSSGLEDEVKKIIKEFKFYVRDSDPVFVEEVTKSIGHLAMNTFGDGKIQAVKLLVQLTKESDYHVMSAAIQVLRSFLSISPTTSSSILPDFQILMKDLVQILIRDQITNDSTRANIYWLLGELHYQISGSDPNFIQIIKFSIEKFIKEGILSKYQIIGLITKSLILYCLKQTDLNSSNIYDQKRIYQLGFDYVMRLARYDEDYGLRNRARYLQGLIKLGGIGLNNQTLDNQIEIKDHESQGVLPMSEEEAFSRGEQISARSKPNQSNKLSLSVLKEIMFLRDRLLKKNISHQQVLENPSRVNSLYSMFGLPSTYDEFGKIRDDTTSGYLSWNTISPWTKLPSSSIIRDPELDENEKTANSGHQKLESSQFTSSSSFSNQSYQQKGAQKREEVVLVPKDDNGHGGIKKRQIGGRYSNLDEFLESSEEEEEEVVSGEEDTEDEDADSSDEDEDSSGEEEEEEEEEEQEQEQEQEGKDRRLQAPSR